MPSILELPDGVVDIHTALDHIRDVGTGLSNAVTITATSLDGAISALEGAIRTSWQTYSSAYAVRGKIDIHM